MTAGYQGEAYARTFHEYGIAQELSHSRGWLLQRNIRDSGYVDAMGLYPLFSCVDWSALEPDLLEYQGQLVSVALVADPLGAHTPAMLARTFPDVSVPFKEHLVIDFTKDWKSTIDSHHIRNIRYANKRVAVERLGNAADGTEDWIRLYDVLIARHGIKGLTAFSPHHFEALLKLPDIRGYRAVSNNQTVGMLLWMLQGDAAYYHLGAYNEDGYASKASYALFDVALSELAMEGFHWASLGGAAGTAGGESGLSRFKEGWANARKTAYFCGRILKGSVYHELTKTRNCQYSGYFPAYRDGEFR